jgi:hypothetical protein
MLAIDNDIGSVYSESTIYDSDIVARGIEDFERNQRLRQFGLLTNVEEEREIDYIESIRNCDYSERERLDNDFGESPHEQENEKCCVKFRKILCNKFFVRYRKTKVLIIIFMIVALIAVITLAYLGALKNRNYQSDGDTNNSTGESTNNTKATTKKGSATTNKPGDGKKIKICIIRKLRDI